MKEVVLKISTHWKSALADDVLMIQSCMQIMKMNSILEASLTLLVCLGEDWLLQV